MTESKRYYFRKGFIISSLLFNIIFLVGLLTAIYWNKNRILQMVGFKQQVTIVMYGDSMMANASWYRLLNRSDVHNSGIGGFTTSHFVWLLKDKVLKYNPKICFLNGGINDIVTGIPQNRIEKNIISIIDTLQKHKIKVVLQAVVYGTDSIYTPDIVSLNNAYEKIARLKNVELINANDQLSKNKKLRDEYSIDGRHVNRTAYSHWAELVKNSLAKNNL